MIENVVTPSQKSGFNAMSFGFVTALNVDPPAISVHDGKF
jgi:flavin reductase (DIM6/NTAB) family NADH-FMN oxidoreductase RutF